MSKVKVNMTPWQLSPIQSTIMHHLLQCSRTALAGNLYAFLGDLVKVSLKMHRKHSKNTRYGHLCRYYGNEGGSVVFSDDQFGWLHHLQWINLYKTSQTQPYKPVCNKGLLNKYLKMDFKSADVQGQLHFHKLHHICDWYKPDKTYDTWYMDCLYMRAKNIKQGWPYTNSLHSYYKINNIMQNKSWSSEETAHTLNDECTSVSSRSITMHILCMSRWLTGGRRCRCGPGGEAARL